MAFLPPLGSSLQLGLQTSQRLNISGANFEQAARTAVSARATFSLIAYCPTSMESLASVCSRAGSRGRKQAEEQDEAEVLAGKRTNKRGSRTEDTSFPFDIISVDGASSWMILGLQHAAVTRAVQVRIWGSLIQKGRCCSRIYAVRSTHAVQCNPRSCIPVHRFRVWRTQWV